MQNPLRCPVRISHRVFGDLRAFIHPALVMFLLLGMSATASGQPGTLVKHELVHNATLRSYSVYLPAFFDENPKLRPIVLNFHGLHDDPAGQMDISQMNAEADRVGAIVVYPQGLEVRLPTVGTGAGWHVPGLTEASQNDVQFVFRIIDEVATLYQGDLDRVHAVGYGNGAAMALYLACAASERMASVAAVSGMLPGIQLQRCGTHRALSVLLMHGTADRHVPIDGTQTYASVQKFLLWWSERNACDTAPVRTELPDLHTGDSGTVTLMKYTGCQSQTELLYYRINQGGRAWPGGHWGTSRNDDINGSGIILDFFMRNARPETVTGIEDPVLNGELDYALHPNHPNPFNPRTTIRFALKGAEHVTVVVYDALGREVRTLVEGPFAKGVHRVVWDGRNDRGTLQPTGIYFYRLETPSFVKTRKMVLAQ